MFHSILLAMIILHSSAVLAENNQPPANPNKKVLYQGFEEVKPNEYINVDSQGSITRSACPYTCEDREIPKQFCKSWVSKSNSKECYVQDTRLKSDAVK